MSEKAKLAWTVKQDSSGAIVSAVAETGVVSMMVHRNIYYKDEDGNYNTWLLSVDALKMKRVNLETNDLVYAQLKTIDIVVDALNKHIEDLVEAQKVLSILTGR